MIHNNWPQGRYITLWELMKLFKLERLMRACQRFGLLQGIQGVSENYAQDEWIPDARELIDEKVQRAIQQECSELQEFCESAGLTVSAKSINRLYRQLGKSVTYRDINPAVRLVQESLFNEAEDRLFYSIERDKQDFLMDGALFGIEVADNFPTAEFDIQEAAKCLALERWTASVFHSMRVLEIGLTELAKQFNVKHDHTNWQPIIDQIEAAIRNIGKAKTTPDWREEDQFYSEAATQFRYFKNAWRNHVMHVRQSYDEERAQEIFNHVKEFMRHLATKLKE